MYLIHRITHERTRSEQLLNEGLLSIGWSIFRKKDIALAYNLINFAKENTKRDFADHFTQIGISWNESWINRTRSYSVYNFLNLNKDSIVIVPKQKNLEIYKVLDDVTVYDNLEDQSDIGFVVKVKKIAENISRYDSVDSRLSSKLKYQRTNLEIGEDEYYLIDRLLENNKKGETIYNFGPTRKLLIESIQSYLNKLTPDQYEILIYNYFKGTGADIVKIPAKNDKHELNDVNADVDIKAAYLNLGICIYVQAKRHEGKTNISGINQLLFYQHEGDPDFEGLIPVKWFMTTAELEVNEDDEKNPLNIALKNNIRIIQGTHFAEMLLDSGFKIDDNAFKI